MAKQYVWLDLETSGLDPVENGIVEIGAVLTQQGKQKKIFSQTCNPGDVAISEYAMKVNGLSIEQLHHEDPINEVLARFDAEVENKAVPCGWNIASFDLPFLKEAYKKAGLKWRFDYHVIDMMCCANWMAASGVLEGNRGTGLQAMAKYLGIDSESFGAAHRALPDVYVTMAVAKELKVKFLSSQKYGF